ncbi:hypothetical protein KA012_01115 [Candidatus Woesebacteria bacterium]|nr:hypothetical protein [Candidatus Woesebacteria bacterium]
MARSVVFGLIVVAILVLGGVESVILLPVFSVGLLLFFVNQQTWQIRLTILVLAALLWGAAQMISPGLLALLLLGGAWTDAWLKTKVNQRMSIFLVVLAYSLLMALARHVPITTSISVTFSVQLYLFWLTSRLLVIHQSKGLQFFLPPQLLQHAKKTQ